MLGAAYASADNWIKLDETNFPDPEFRNYLLDNCKTTVWSYDSKKYNKTTGEINTDAFTEINISVATNVSSIRGVKVNYFGIKNLDGIKLFTNLKTLKIPWPSFHTGTFSLEYIDVSGMPNLETITDNMPIPKFSGLKAANPDALMTGFKAVLRSVDASNCPALKTVNLQRYETLADVDISGSNNITDLYLACTGIRSLDISALSDLRCASAAPSDTRFGTEFGYNTNLTNVSKYIRCFSLRGCAELQQVNMGNSKLNYLDISNCNTLEELDISGLDSLFRFCAVFEEIKVGTPDYASTAKECTSHAHPSDAGGALRILKLPDAPHIYELQCNFSRLQSLDVEPIAPAIVDLDLAHNNLRSFNIAALKKISTLNLSRNRIHHLDLPANPNINTLSISDNCLTEYPQIGTQTTYPNISVESPYQYIRVGNVHKYRVFEDAATAQFVERQDDSSLIKYFYAPTGGHIGNPEMPETDIAGNPTGRMEDARYFYFDDKTTDGVYFLRNLSGKASDTHPSNGWFKVVLCRSNAVDFDPENHQFYLTGDFNNWQPTEKDRFIPDGNTGIYNLVYNNQEIVHGHFRVWDKTTESDVQLNFGSHADESAAYVGKDNHTLMQANTQHKTGTDPVLHFTTYRADIPQTQQTGYLQPHFSMQAIPGSDSNYLMLASGSVTGVNDIMADTADNDSVGVLYTPDGRLAPANPTPGVYIRRCGANAQKVLIR